MSEVASGSKVVAKEGFGATTALTPMEQGPYLQALTMEPATRIERATCGLRNFENPSSENPTPQETRTLMIWGVDGTECPVLVAAW